MEHNEDEQPNESVYGRRKRILPFVKNTSRIQGQKIHQFAPILVPVPPSESTRGRGYNRGRGRDRGRGRGQGKNRGRGGGPPPAPELPQFREFNPWAQLDDLREHTPQTTIPEPSTPPQRSFGMQLGPSSGRLPPEIPKFEVIRQRLDDWAPGPSMLGPQPPIRPFQNSKQPRKRFRPGKNDTHKYNNQPNTVNTTVLAAGPSVNRQIPRVGVEVGRGDLGLGLSRGLSKPREDIKGVNATFSITSVSLGVKKKHRHRGPTRAQSEASTSAATLHIPQELVDPLRDDGPCPPAKRPRIQEEASPSRASPSTVALEKAVKSEIEDDTAIELLQEKPSSGTKFVSYDNHPMCRFNCGELPSQVRKHRKVLRGQESRALRDQGKEVLAAFIRDDGIAIDWIIPTRSEAGGSTPKSMSPVIIPDDPEINTPPSEEADPPALPPANWALPSHLNPLVVSMDKFDGRRSSTPTTTEIAYREVPIPPRHLPQDGNTRKLEIWALGQMRLLEAELGPVILPPPELVGVGEYITGQELPEGIHPHIKLRYKRTVRVQPSVEPSTNSEETFSLAELMAESPATLPEYPSTAHITSIDLLEPTLPLIMHLETAGSPSTPSSPPLIKGEVDELADDPPSLPASPKLALVTDEDDTPIPTIEFLSRNSTGEPQVTTTKESPRVASNDSNTDLDELQRLRNDLELSKLEAERKHKELELRIFELSQKRSETYAPGPNVEQPLATVRIADEGKSNILPLRRGKYDKTRRLLAVSGPTILHVSWLGVMQLVNRNSRRIVATGFGSDAPSSISVEDACSLSPSSTALALSGNESQLAIAMLGEGNFGFLPLRDQPHDAKGICSIVPVDPQSAITLGHDRRYIHWKFQQDQCSVDPLPLPKLHLCTALAFDPVHNNLVTTGSESNKRSKLTLYNLADPMQMPNTVELSNHPHHVHVDPDDPFLLILELARLDDQFQVHDIRMPLYQCVQKFGYQNVIHEKAEFRVRGSSRGNYFARGDTGIVRLWDRRSPKSHQTIPVIPHQRVVDVILDHSLISCATEAHHIVTYPIL
ncbi:unnamed protein product [Rhizoctonia solani]|uniref:Uncharacterized protein n=1 Tax=Rhizoctonia solani TaxID=456999 RepID=A0A8H3DM30_9AGAM|nr:unnamed protein product [Rhizoctonia solani]